MFVKGRGRVVEGTLVPKKLTDNGGALARDTFFAGGSVVRMICLQIHQEEVR